MLTNLALLAAVGLASPAPALEVLLEDFSTARERYQHTLGGEFPGAQATFSWEAEGHDAAGALRVDYDFTEGGRYCQWHYAGWVPDRATAICISASGKSGTELILRVVDGTDQYHQFVTMLEDDGWQRVTLPLDVTKSRGHWGGANDGDIHQPLKHIFLGPESATPTEGTLLLDRLAVETEQSQTEVTESKLTHFLATAHVLAEADEPGLLLNPDGSRVLRLSIPDVPPGIDSIRLALSVTDAHGSPVAGLPGELELTPETFTAALTVPEALGYYAVAYEVSASAGGEKRAGAPGTVSFGVVPEPRRGKQPESPFGVNTHFNQGWSAELGAIVKRAGIGWIRDGEANLEDRALPVAKANELCYMPCFTWYRKPLEEHHKPDGTWDFSTVADWHREYAAEYGADIDAYDLVNEPHGQWAEVLGGDWSGGPWQDVFVTYGRQVTEAIKSADPTAAVLWEDIDQLLWYRRFQELGAGDVIDHVSPHPYNMHRGRPLPEDHPILGQMAEFREFAAEHDLPWEVWAGEVGFSSFELTDKTPGGFYTPHTELQQANMLVRMMVLQLSAGVRRIFWYDFYNDGTEAHNPEHNFGIIRHDRTPKPAIIAYAYLSHRLSGCRWLGSYAIGGGADAVAYVAEASGKPVVIAWLRRGERTEAFRVPGEATEVTVTDIFGASRHVPVEDHMLMLGLSETPVYVDGLTMEDVEGFVTPAPAPR